MKLLSVIIPVYNTKKYLTRCLDSLDSDEIEIIAVDDGSVDGSSEILDEYAFLHSNLTVIHTSNNDAATARLIGLNEVRTKYFSFVDSDDTVNIKNYLSLVKKMELVNQKVGNGRMNVYLPDINFPFSSRKWHKDIIYFDKEKFEFGNITCSLLDKIWHIDCAPCFMEKSSQVVYEDMEFVYYALAKQGSMLHSDNVIYNYRMRGLQNNSTSALGLQMTKVNGLEGLLNAASSMKEKFIRDGLYENYKSELDSIIIKLVYQRICSIFRTSVIINKREMASLVLSILDSYIPNWRNNKYFLEGFKGSELNDYIFYIVTRFILNVYRIDSTLSGNYQELLNTYESKLILRK